MKRFAACFVSLLVCACASQLTFVEQETGQAYSGVMQGSVSEDGSVSAVIDGVPYEGTWAIENSGSAIDFGDVEYDEKRRLTTTTSTRIGFGNTNSRPDTAIGFARIKENSAAFLTLESHAGSGRIVMTSASDDQLLCRFDPTARDAGLSGICTRNDGTSYDLFVAN